MALSSPKNDQLGNVNGSNVEYSMENVNSSIRNPFALISVLITMLLHKTSESDHNKREAEKMKNVTELLKEEIMQIKKEKGPSIDTKENEDMTNGSYQHNQNPLLPPLFDPENPFFQICGVRINLRGYNHPDSVTIQHSLPEGLDHFDKLRREGMNYDKKIIIGNTKIDVHKELLTARIPYFKNLFASNWRESSWDIINLSFEFDSSIFEVLVDWAYNGIISINMDNVQFLMKAASYLFLDTVVEECFMFMRKRIEYDGAIPLLNFCHSIGFYTTSSLMNFIDANFILISNTPEFLELSIDDLLNIIKRKTLNVDRDTQVFDGVVNWIGESESRKKLIPRILKTAECPRLSSSFLNDIVEKNKWIMDIPQSIDIINEAQKVASNSLFALKSLPRKGYDFNNIIFVTSSNDDYNENNNESTTVDIFDSMRNEWTRAIIDCKKVHTETAVIGNKIYFMGQFFNEDTDDYDEPNMITYDTYNNEWSEMPMPNYVKRDSGVTGVIDGIIYSAGGERVELDKDSLRSLWAFDPSNPSRGWRRLANMKRGRVGHSMCVMNGNLFVIGGYGYDDYDMNEWCDGEFYDPSTDKWTSIAAMPESRVGSGAAIVGGEIYLLGGSLHRGSEELPSLLKYSPASDSWTTLKSMKYVMFDKMVTTCGGKVFVCGGRSSHFKQFLDVDCYDPLNDTWTAMETLRECPKDAIMCSISVPSSFPVPNMEMADYGVKMSYQRQRMDRN